MDKKIIETFLQAYEELNGLKGRTIHFSIDRIKEICEDGFIKNIGQYINKDNTEVEVSISPQEYERYMVLYVIMDMIKDGEIELTLTNKATNKHINYINKLIDSLENTKE